MIGRGTAAWKCAVAAGSAAIRRPAVPAQAVQAALQPPAATPHRRHSAPANRPSAPARPQRESATKRRSAEWGRPHRASPRRTYLPPYLPTTPDPSGATSRARVDRSPSARNSRSKRRTSAPATHRRAGSPARPTAYRPRRPTYRSAGQKHPRCRTVASMATNRLRQDAAKTNPGCPDDRLVPAGLSPALVVPGLRPARTSLPQPARCAGWESRTIRHTAKTASDTSICR